MDIIYLEEMIFHAYHGVHSFEKEEGGKFRVDLELHLDLSKPGSSDLLKDTIDYEYVYKLTRSEMEERSALIENLAYRIKDKLLQEFKSLQKVIVKVSKISPPIKGDVGATSVQVSGKQNS